MLISLTLFVGSRQLLHRALAGSLPDLRELNDAYSTMAHPESAVLDVLPVTLKFLRADLVPTLSTPIDRLDFQLSIDRATTCLFTLSTALSACARSPSAVARNAVSSLLMGSVDDVCHWTRLFLLLDEENSMDSVIGPLRMYRKSASILRNIISLSESLYDICMSSSDFLDLVLRIWLRVDGEGELLLGIAEDSTESHSIPILLKQCVSTKYGFDAILQRIVSNGLMARFASTICCRVQGACESSFARAQPHEAIQYIQETLEIPLLIQGITGDLYSSGLVEDGWLFDLISSLDRLSQTLETRSAGSMMPLFHQVVTVIRLAYNSQSRTTRNWRDLVRGGLIPVLLRILRAIPKNGKGNVDQALAMLAAVSTHTVYPCVARAILKEYPSGKIPRLINARNPKVASLWSPCWDNFNQCATFFELYQRQSAVPQVCDNPLVRQW